jgi:flagellar biogenesis protein FliO
MSPVTSYLVETFLTLVGVVLLAVVVLYGARRLGVGKATGPLELLGRLPLEGRRAVYLVRVGRTAFVIGASERGLTRLGELGADTLGAPTDSLGAPADTLGARADTLGDPTPERAAGDAPRASFAEVLARIVPGQGDGKRD